MSYSTTDPDPPGAQRCRTPSSAGTPLCPGSFPLCFPPIDPPNAGARRCRTPSSAGTPLRPGSLLRLVATDMGRLRSYRAGIRPTSTATRLISTLLHLPPTDPDPTGAWRCRTPSSAGTPLCPGSLLRRRARGIELEIFAFPCALSPSDGERAGGLPTTVPKNTGAQRCRTPSSAGTTLRPGSHSACPPTDTPQLKPTYTHSQFHAKLLCTNALLTFVQSRCRTISKLR
jgi:hypothetical protein